MLLICSALNWTDLKKYYGHWRGAGPVLFNIFINDTDSGIKCTLRNSADNTEPSGVADKPEGQDVIHRDLDKLEKQAYVNAFSFNEVLHMAWGQHGSNTGREIKGMIAALQRGISGCLWMSWTWASTVHLQPRKPNISWAASKASWPAWQGKEFCPSVPLRWDPTWSVASRSGILSTERHEPVGAG